MKITIGILFGIVFYNNALAIQSIDTSYSIQIGGIKQWINIKGKDIEMPVILWLHGGPGVSAMGYGNKISNKLQEHFIVVQWDQRETGKTAELNHTANLSVQQMNQDVYDISQYLIEKFKKKKLFFIGNSWGGYLALHAVNQFPELIEACILISPIVYGNESEIISLKYVTEEANKEKNKTAIEEISKIKVPFERPMDIWLLRKWMFTFNGEKVSRALPPETFFLDYVDKWFITIKESFDYDPFVEIKKTNCPMFFLLGKSDYITHTEIAQRFYEQLNLSIKNIFWFQAGHMIPSKRPKEMQDVIINQILPLFKGI